MGQTVTFEVKTQHASAVAGFLQVVQAAEMAGRAGETGGQRMKQSGEQAGEAWGRGLSILNSYPAAMLKMVTGATAVYAAIAQIRNELERVDMVRGKALDGLDQAMEPYKRATLQMPKEYVESETFRRLSQQGIRNRGDAPSYFSGLANAMSAAGYQLDTEEVQKMVNMLAEFTGKENIPAEDWEALIGGFVRSLQTERRIVEGQEGRRLSPKELAQRVKPKELLGTMISGWPASQPVDMGKWATYELQMQDLLMANAGFTREEAIGLASTYGLLMEDPWGRRTRTAGLLFERDLANAYQFAAERGVPFMQDGKEVSIEQFRKMGLKQLDIARSDTETGLMMRSYLAPRTDEDRDLARAWHGLDYHGSLQGEAGAKEVGELFLSPDSPVMADTLRVLESIKRGKEAEKLVDDRLSGPPLSPQDELFRKRHLQKGTLAAAQWGNVEQAHRGSFKQFVDELGDITGTYDLQQKMRGLEATWRSSGKTQDEIAQLEREAVERAIQDIINRTTPQSDPGFLKWAKKHRPDMHRGVWGTLWSRDSKPYPRSVFEEYRRHTMRDDEKAIVGALEGYLGGAGQLPAGTKPPGFPGYQEWLEQTGRYDLPTGGIGWGIPSYFIGGDNRETYRREHEAFQQRQGQSPAPTDQSSLQGEIRQLIAAVTNQTNAIANQTLTVTVQDGVGRQLSRTTSRPRSLEQFTDESGIG